MQHVTDGPAFFRSGFCHFAPPGEVRHMLLNLLSSAVKLAGPGRTAERAVAFTGAGTGHSVIADQLERIGAPFV